MGFFDFFKSPEEKEKEVLYATVFQQAFPGGSNQLENETVKLCEILEYKYPIEEVRRVYTLATNYYFLNPEKSEENIAVSLLLSEGNIIKKKHAFKISNFLVTKLKKYEITKSLLIIATRLKCDIITVKEVYLNRLRKDQFGIPEINQLLEAGQEAKITQALQFNMAQDHTPAAIMYEWTKELLTLIKKEERNALITSSTINPLILNKIPFDYMKQILGIESYIPEIRYCDNLLSNGVDKSARLPFITFIVKSDKGSKEMDVGFTLEAGKDLKENEKLDDKFFDNFMATEIITSGQKARPYWSLTKKENAKKRSRVLVDVD